MYVHFKDYRCDKTGFNMDKAVKTVYFYNETGSKGHDVS